MKQEEVTSLSAIIDCSALWPRTWFRKIGDGQVQQLNVHDYYELGKKIEEVTSRISKFEPGEIELSAIGWPLFILRLNIESLLGEPCALLPASQRAARLIVESISQTISDDPSDLFDTAKASAKIQIYQLGWITSAISQFETVLKNDMPEMSTFAVAQIGMYRTEDLIGRSTLQIEEGVRDYLLPLAENDILEAGKCLAFRVPTAAAFHLSRAIETGMNQYYASLTQKPYDLKPGANNWGTKIKLLEEKGADSKITAFLLHIKDAYRNPITHPEEIVEPGEAFGFFNQALSVISLMLSAVKVVAETNQTPMLEGLSLGLTEALEENHGGLLLSRAFTDASVQPSDNASAFDIENGTAAKD